MITLFCYCNADYLTEHKAVLQLNIYCCQKLFQFVLQYMKIKLLSARKLLTSSQNKD